MAREGWDYFPGVPAGRGKGRTENPGMRAACGRGWMDKPGASAGGGRGRIALPGVPARPRSDAEAGLGSNSQNSAPAAVLPMCRGCAAHASIAALSFGLTHHRCVYADLFGRMSEGEYPRLGMCRA